VAPDAHTAEELWIRAAGLRGHEARLRLAAAAVHGRSERLDIAGALAVLEKGTQEGSLLAAVAIAGSYERGIGRSVNIGEAVRRYRDCAVRGSGTAWHALLRLHDNRRPEETEFHIRR
jgi:TPR repeat protein